MLHGAVFCGDGTLSGLLIYGQTTRKKTIRFGGFPMFIQRQTHVSFSISQGPPPKRQISFGYDIFWGSVTRDAARILLRRSVTEVLVMQVCNGKKILTTRIRSASMQAKLRQKAGSLARAGVGSVTRYVTAM